MQVLLEKTERAFCDSSNNFLQTGFWGAFKSLFGFKAHHFIVDSSYPLLVLERPLKAGFTFAYIPFFEAGEKHKDSNFLASIAKEVKKHLSKKCIYIRFDAAHYFTGTENKRPVLGAPLRKAPSDVQPPDTVFLNLKDKTEDQVFSEMKPKWRYNIKLSEKKGVVVKEEGLSALAEFYKLYEITSKRDKIALHPEKYYRALFELKNTYDTKSPELFLYTARHEGTLLAAIIVMRQGKETTYVYGASSDEKRNLMPAYGLQWLSIKDAIKSSSEIYDFYGIPPTDDENHPMHGLYRFKTGFGGEVIHRAGSYDLPYKPFLYSLFTLLERLRVFYYKDFLKRKKKHKKVNVQSNSESVKEENPKVEKVSEGNKGE